MDYNVPGRGKSPCDSQLDFIDYWTDKSVKDAVLKGISLRQQKPHPTPTQKECNIVKVEVIKPPCRRNKSPRKSTKRRGSISQIFRGASTSRSTSPCKSKKCRCKTVSCGMRIAQLAEPTKRQCLDTWRNRYSTLPAFMIERLRQHVMDQRPVVQIADAFTCFKRVCKNNSELKSSAHNKKTKRRKKTNNNHWNTEVKTMSAILAFNIAKKLNTPMNIILNSDLQKIADVVSYDVSKMMFKSKIIDMNKPFNQHVHEDIVKKITAWISDVLEESDCKYLDDELKDFEEELGPVLEFIDSLIDQVLDICAPQLTVTIGIPQMSSSESSEASLREEEAMTETSSKKIDLEDASLTANDAMTEGGTDVFGIDIDNTTSYENLDINEDQDGHLSEDAEANDTDTIIEENLDSEALSEPANENEESAEIDTETKNDESVAPEDITDELENPEEVLENNEDATENKEPSEGSTDENDKKVTFDQDEENFKPKMEHSADIDWKASIEHIDFAPPNEDLLSDADESWPDEIEPPVLRPSQSVSKSITSLGQIKEDEEIASMVPDTQVVDNVDVPPEDQADQNIDNIEGTNTEEQTNMPYEDTVLLDTVPKDKVLESETVKEEAAIEKKRESSETRGDKTKADGLSKTPASESVKKTQKKTPLNSEKKTVKKTTPAPEKKTVPGAGKKKLEKKTTPDSVKKTTIDPENKTASDLVKKMPKTKKPNMSKTDIEKHTGKLLSSTAKKGGKRNLHATINVKPETSHSAIDLLSKEDNAKDINISSLKAKPDYRVHTETAPAWISRNYREPSCSCVNFANQRKKVKEQSNYLDQNQIRIWCQDMDQSYENLKMWNQWIDSTTRAICMLQQEIGFRSQRVKRDPITETSQSRHLHLTPADLDRPDRCVNREYMKLKGCIDKDVTHWKTLNRNTQQRMKGYRSLYQKRSKISRTYTIVCDCPPKS